MGRLQKPGHSWDPPAAARDLGTSLEPQHRPREKQCLGGGGPGRAQRAPFSPVVGSSIPPGTATVGLGLRRGASRRTPV